MISLRDICVFLAGAEFYHTFTHILLPYFVTLPIQIGTFTLTPTINNWAILANAIITLILLWLAAIFTKPKVEE